ncbi:MAG: pyridoxal-phosphate dependent enzyme, partial [Candidatus Dormiibacterota bacterium]
VPDAVVLPVAYGDALSGVYRGFKELLQAGLIARIPRLFAAETFPSLSGALATDSPSPVATRGGPSRSMSVATPTGTYQSLRAIRESEGGAVPVSDGETARAHADLRRSGLLVEFSSAMPLAAVRRLVADGELHRDDRVVLVITSSGLKDLELTGETEEAPLVEANLASLSAELARRFAFRA